MQPYHDSIERAQTHFVLKRDSLFTPRRARIELKSNDVALLSISASNKPIKRLDATRWAKMSTESGNVYLNISSVAKTIGISRQKVIAAARKEHGLENLLLQFADSQQNELNDQARSLQEQATQLHLSPEEFLKVSAFIKIHERKAQESVRKGVKGFLRIRSSEVARHTGVKRTIVFYPDKILVQDDKQYLIGQGKFKKVKQALDPSSGIIYAIYSASAAGRINGEIKLIAEEKMMRKLEGTAHSIPLHNSAYYMSSKEGKLKQQIVTDVYTGDLKKFIKLNKPLTVSAKAELMVKMNSALKECHMRGVTHKDIKEDNFLLGKDGQIVLADFGFADDVLFENAGTYRYAAPEVYGNNTPRSSQDIYSLGVVFYRLWTGDKQPRYVSNNILPSLDNESSIFTELKNSQDPIAKMIVQMLEIDPGLRPNSDEISAVLSSLS